MIILTLNSKHKADLIRILDEYQLVTQDLNFDEQCYVGIQLKNELIAIGGIEFKPPYALLRSIAVTKDHKGNGYAKKIFVHLSEQALLQGINELYLLTESAENYFLKLGFSVVNRSDVPGQIKHSNQFSTLCPKQASVMKKSILSI